MKQLLLALVLSTAGHAQISIGFTKFTTPTLTGAWVNQGDASISDANGYLTITAPTGSYQLRVYKWSLGANTTATGVMQIALPLATGGIQQLGGLVARKSSTGQLIFCGYTVISGDRTSAATVIIWDSPTQPAVPPVPNPVRFQTGRDLQAAGTKALRIVSNGSTVSCQIAPTPRGSWVSLYSETIGGGNWMTTAPDEIGLAVGVGNVADSARFLSLKLE